MRRTSLVDIGAESEVSEDSDDMSINEVQCEETGMNKSFSRTNADPILQLDDEALFGIIKKIACNGLRQILSGSIGPIAGSSSIPLDGLGIGIHRGVVSMKKTSLFSKVIDKLSPEKKLVIRAYGFESLLSFDNCEIPLPFAWWLADHVDVRNSQIIVNNMCIPLSSQLVHDVLGIPMGAKTIANDKSDSVKEDFLSVMGLDSLPSASICAENLLKDGLSDDDIVRNFLILAMVTFLCPNSKNYPTTKYLQPLIDVKVAKEWDWCTFVLFWLLNQIKKYNLLKKKTTHPSVFLGGCLYLICVLYLDFLDMGKEPLPSIFPRIKVWKGVMIKEYSESDVEGHSYGKHPILGLQYTCYGKRNSTRTPSPSCNIDVSCFKKILADSVSASLSPRTLDDVSALYLKHATSPNELVPVHVQNAIVDVINYFCHRAQTDKNARSKDDSDFVSPQNDSDVAVKSHTAESEGHVHNNDSQGIQVGGTIVGVFPHRADSHPHYAHDDVHRTLGDASLLNDDGHIIHGEIAAGNNVAHVSDASAPCYANGCNATMPTTEGVANENVAISPDELYGGNTIVPIAGNQKDTSSGDTLILPSCEGGASSVKASFSNTEIISSSPTFSDSVQLSQGVSLLKRKRVSSPITSLNIEVVGSFSRRTQSRRLSLSPEADTNQASFKDNPEALLTNNNKERIVTKMTEICQNLYTASNAIDVGDNTVTLANKSASFSHMVREDISSHKSRDLVAPYDNVCHRGPSLHTPENSNAGLGLPNSTISGTEKVNSWDFPVPTFLILDESDDSTCVASHNDIFNEPIISDSNIVAQKYDQGPVYDGTPPSCSHEMLNCPSIGDANINAQNNDKAPVFDGTPSSCSHEFPDCTPNAIPLAALDTAGHLAVTSSQERPSDVHVTGHRSHVTESDGVDITGEKQLIVSKSRMAQDAENIYDANGGSCFHRCQKIGFNLGSSSKGKIGKSHRRRRIIQPNSYFRDFQVNVCNARYGVTIPERQVYECVLFYSQFPDHARDQVINYDKVRVTFEELGSSMRRCEKQSVHNHVVNAFCRKLFKDKHPSKSRRHYFFSPVGDYLMDHNYEGNQSYLHDNCKRCFKHANISFDFKSSDFLFFPIFHDTHWFVFVVALRDGYFVFLDSFFDEESLYQKEVRHIVIPNFLRAWDEFVQCDWNFHEFVVHYATVPQQDRRFSGSKFDDGIFVMKFLEIWDPCINMMVQFSSSHIQEFRMLLVNIMIFSKHNSCNEAKKLVSDHKTMLALRTSMSNLPLSMF